VTLTEQRNNLTLKLQDAIVDPENIRVSAIASNYAGNVLLADCVINGNCSKTLTDPEHQIGFYLMTQKDGTNKTKFEVLAGPQGAPRLYDVELSDDDKGISGPAFPFAAYAFFWVTCPIDISTGRPANQCRKPAVINFRFLVQQSYMPGGKQEELRVAPFPPVAAFYKSGARHHFSYSLSMASIASILMQNCPPGAVSKGFDANGTIRCECITQQIGTAANGQPICDKGTCDLKTQRMAGIYTSGPNKGMPICEDNKAPVCWTIQMKTNPSDCGDGAWMTRIEHGICYAENTKKGGGQAINCQSDQATCCRPLRY
jgi:hypothetical protein